jgi:hypothetical protein
MNKQQPKHDGGSHMEEKTQKRTPKAYYLGMLALFAVLILWAFLRNKP